MSARLIDWPPRRTLPVSDPVVETCDVAGLALHLADLAGDDWRALTPERREKLEQIARLAMSAARGKS